jgi:GNAT superfamily N-acetyltransferase
MGPFPEDDRDGLDTAEVVLAAGDPAVGFVSVRLLDGDAHIGQLSVVPEYGRRGIGRRLLDEAIGWARHQGLSGVTLTTFRDVPWNAPFYLRVGFEELVDLPPGLAAVRTDERERGFDAMGPRLAMRLAL